MINVGILGFGFMGRTHMEAWQGVSDATVVALCARAFDDGVNPDRTSGNINQGGELDFMNVQLFNDFDTMLANAELDAISITLPTFLHCESTVKALKAGLHVLCEKPMALSLEECDTMVATAKDCGKHLQVAHCIRFWPEYMKVKELVDSNQFGTLEAAHFFRLGSKPGWAKENWMADSSKSGGALVDLHIHDTDFILHLLGMPKAVNSHGTLNHCQTQFDYEPGQAITAEGSWLMSESFGFRMGFHLVLEKAVIEFNTAIADGLRVYPANGDAYTVETDGGTGYTNQIDHFAKVIHGEDVAPIITPEGSRDSITVVLAEKESVLSGNPVDLYSLSKPRRNS